MTASYTFQQFADSDAAALAWVDRSVVAYLPRLKITAIAVRMVLCHSV